MKIKSRKVLILFGSPHKNGYTSQILEFLINFFENCKVKTVNAYGEAVHPCIDCKICKNSQTCFFDDMDNIDTFLQDCDILIIASPVYNLSFPSPLKAILDRTERYYNARMNLGIKSPVKKAKNAIVILTQGAEGLAEDVIKAQLNPILNLLGAKGSQYCTLRGTDAKDFDINKKLLKAQNNIQNIINNLYKEIERS